MKIYQDRHNRFWIWWCGHGRAVVRCGKVRFELTVVKLSSFELLNFHCSNEYDRGPQARGLFNTSPGHRKNHS